MTYRAFSLSPLALAVGSLLIAPTYAEENQEPMEEIVVTGSYIKSLVVSLASVGVRRKQKHIFRGLLGNRARASRRAIVTCLGNHVE